MQFFQIRNFINYSVMKKTFWIVFALFVYSTTTLIAADKSSIVKDILREYAVHKVEKMQKLIRFDDEQAKQLVELETNFLLDVQKAENCSCCKSKKRVEKLQINKERELQKILTKEQYYKYDAVEKNRIQKGELRAD